MKTYFIVFKAQEGELAPAYSYVNEDSLKDLKKQKIVAWEMEVDSKNIRTPEETKIYLEQYEKQK